MDSPAWTLFKADRSVFNPSRFFLNIISSDSSRVRRRIAISAHLLRFVKYRLHFRMASKQVVTIVHTIISRCLTYSERSNLTMSNRRPSDPSSNQTPAAIIDCVCYNGRCQKTRGTNTHTSPSQLVCALRYSMLYMWVSGWSMFMLDNLVACVVVRTFLR